MLAAKRRQIIAKLIRQQTSVQVSDLCARLGASPSTIRRDLEHLEQQKVLERTYGGAVLVTADPILKPPPSPSLDPEKERIGAAAAELIGEGETVFVGPGTTTMAVARHLAAKEGVTVVTDALDVASYLTHHSQLPVILTGGQVERQETALLGHVAELTLRELRADRAVLGVGGIHVTEGITGERLSAVRFMRIVIDLMPEVILVADHRKWGRVGPAFLAPLEAIDMIVTDTKAPSAMVWDLSELGIKIIQV